MYVLLLVFLALFLQFYKIKKIIDLFETDFMK